MKKLQRTSTIFIQGADEKTVPIREFSQIWCRLPHRNDKIVIAKDTKLETIYEILHDRDIIPLHVKPHLRMYYDSWRLQPLRDSDTLTALGIGSLSTLFLRICLPGGASDTEDQCEW